MFFSLHHEWVGYINFAVHRVEVQILLQYFIVVLLGQHSLLRTVSQAPGGWRLHDQEEAARPAEVPRPKGLPSQGQSPTAWHRGLPGLCHLSQCTEFLSGSLLGCFLVFSSSFSPF
jgi:hypothetical protein